MKRRHQRLTKKNGLLVKQSLLILLAVLVIIAAVDGEVLRFGFVGFWDDKTNIFDNPLYAPLTWKNIFVFWQRPYMELFLPVTYTFWAGLVALSRFLAGLPLGF
ncbi:MAG: hypothetical protein ACH346_04700, partial [Chthoniobacterales bacterium]